MIKQRILYSSPLDALITVTKRLSLYEKEKGLSSEDFFDQYTKGLLTDEIAVVEWANDYRHYLALHQEIQKKLSYAA